MKNKFVIFGIAFVLFLFFQAKVIMPIIYDIVASDLFLEDTGDDGNRFSANTTMTDEAFAQCNRHIAEELPENYSLNFFEAPLNAFSLGAYEYLINAEIEIIANDSVPITKKYVCKIKYDNNDEATDLSNPEVWSVNAISGIDEL